MGDLLNDDTIKDREQLCGPWLLERGFAMVFAPTGVGKSWFAMAVAAAVASGGKFGHWSAPEPRRVLYIDGEMDASDLKSRFKLVINAAEGGTREQIAENVLMHARNDQPLGDTTFPDFGKREHEDRISRLVQEFRPDLVVLDNLSTLAMVDDTNAAASWDPFLRILQRIRDAGAAVLVVHHSNKGGETYNGSSKIPIMFDSLVRLRPDTRPNCLNGAAFLLNFAKTRMLTEDAGKTFNVTFANEQWQWGTLVDPKVLELVQHILDGKCRNQTEAAAALGVVKSTVSKMLSAAYAAGVTTPEAIKAAFRDAKEEADETIAEGDVGF